MFYCIYVFNHQIYYLEDEELIVIYESDDEQVDIFDIVSKKEVDINSVLSKICDSKTNKVIFHYTPDYKGIKTQRNFSHGDNVLFVKTSGNNEFFVKGKHPITSQA